MKGLIRIIIIAVLTSFVTVQAFDYWQHSIVDTLLTAYVCAVLLSLLLFSGGVKT